MNLRRNINAPKTNESLLYGVGYKPFVVGVLYLLS